MRERLRRANFVESHTAITLLAALTMARFTRDSRTFGVVSPSSTSTPSTLCHHNPTIALQQAKDVLATFLN
jgi:hypothetical protein